MCGAVRALSSSNNKFWSIHEFPNPMTNPKACGREGVGHSAICDPDRIMSIEGGNALEMIINNVTEASGQSNAPHSVEVGIALVQAIDLALYGSDIDVAAKKFAMGVHNKVFMYIVNTVIMKKVFDMYIMTYRTLSSFLSGESAIKPAKMGYLYLYPARTGRFLFLLVVV